MKLSGFSCPGLENVPFPGEVLHRAGFSPGEISGDPEAMAELSAALADYEKSPICWMPFGTAAQAQILGAEVEPDVFPPAVGQKKYPDIRAFCAKPPAKNHETAGKLFESVRILCAGGKTAALTVEGPFTVLSQLVGTEALFAAMEDENMMRRALDFTADSVRDFMTDGIRGGAKILSYADPAGAPGILGPGMSERFSGRFTAKILSGFREKIPSGTLVHLCGADSQALFDAGLCRVKPVPVEPETTYPRAVCRALGNAHNWCLGMGCLKNTRCKTGRLYRLEFAPAL